MKNWVSKICHKIRQRTTHSLKNPIHAKHDLRINGFVCACDDAKPPLEHGHHFNGPASLDPKVYSLSNEIAFENSGTYQNLNKESPPSAQVGYLRQRENCEQDIHKLVDILKMPQVVMEVGCGNAATARQIALKNPNLGVIATDLYDWSHPQYSSSGYGQIAREWRTGQLPAQMNPLSNLVILRAETDLLQCLPINAIDTIMLINPEPLVGKAVLALLHCESISTRIKYGPTQIVILPYSRELGLMACGGCEFEHDQDWSRGLGFLMASGLRFKRGPSVQWGVDLARISAYTGNSTQRDIFTYGKPLS